MADVTEFPQPVVADEQELTAADIFAANDQEPYPVEVPEWGKNGKPGILYLKPLNADSAITFQNYNQEQRKAMFVRILAEVACDKTGKALFKTSDIEQLKKKSTAVFFRLQRLVMQNAGMTPPVKTWATVSKILSEAEVEPAVIALVKSKWDKHDEDVMSGAVKND